MINFELGNIGEIRYTPYNLPTTLIKNGQAYQYRYDGSGKRIEKVQPNGSFESYRRGANGELLAIYDNLGALKQFELDGMGEARFETGDAQQKGSSAATSGNWQFLYYDKDILGNNRMLIKQDGTIARTFDPDPWGFEETRRTFGNTTVDNKFTGKQNDRETGLDYFGARYYNNKTASWLQSEPLYHKYPSITPYNYGMNNPLRHIDVDGRDIIVVNGQDRAGFQGHSGLLIGNEKTGYTYISRDGAMGESAPVKGQAYYNIITGIGSINDFLNTEDGKTYDRGVLIPSNEKQDALALQSAWGEITAEYNVLTNNCGDLVGNALKSAGIGTGEEGKVLGITRPNSQFGELQKQEGNTTLSFPTNSNKAVENSKILDNKRKAEWRKKNAIDNEIPILNQ